MKNKNKFSKKNIGVFLSTVMIFSPILLIIPIYAIVCEIIDSKKFNDYLVNVRQNIEEKSSDVLKENCHVKMIFDSPERKLYEIQNNNDIEVEVNIYYDYANGKKNYRDQDILYVPSKIITYYEYDPFLYYSYPPSDRKLVLYYNSVHKYDYYELNYFVDDNVVFYDYGHYNNDYSEADTILVTPLFDNKTISELDIWILYYQNGNIVDYNHSYVHNAKKGDISEKFYKKKNEYDEYKISVVGKREI